MPVVAFCQKNGNPVEHEADRQQRKKCCAGLVIDRDAAPGDAATPAMHKGNACRCAASKAGSETENDSCDAGCAHGGDPNG